jgi:hypothetical protein
MLNQSQKYRFACTLKFGDIYGQVMVWLIVIFIGLAASIALYDNPVNALLAGGLILVLSLPFLLFAFVTTLLNHIEMNPLEVKVANSVSAPEQQRPSGSGMIATN